MGPGVVLHPAKRVPEEEQRVSDGETAGCLAPFVGYPGSEL